MSNAARSVTPLSDRLERIIDMHVRNVCAKPGFINTAATRDYLARAMRCVLLDAAAPDLLAACEAVANDNELQMRGQAAPGYLQHWKAIRAAIAKAKGAQ